MRAQLLFFILFGLILQSNAQNIDAIEYFIDSDPGFGLATPVSISSSNNITVNFVANLNGITNGYHVLFIRSKDSNGKWSLTANQSFYKSSFFTPTNILAMEYFIDNDPGFGLGSNIPITPGANVTQSFVANISNLSSGFHTLYVRSKSTYGNWSLTANSSFYVTNAVLPVNIVRMEYFVDYDPGFGLANTIPVFQGTDVTKTLVANLNNLTQGNHNLFIRSLDNTGRWSLTAVKPFYFCSSIPNAIITGPSPNIVCVGNGVTLNATGGLNYIWNTGETSSSIIAYPTSDSLFSVTALDALGCTDTASFNVYVDVCSGLLQSSVLVGTIEIYPNPFNQFVSIKSNTKINLVEVYSLEGKLLYSEIPIDNQIDLEKLPAGGYLIRALSDNQSVKKLIIKTSD